MPSFNQTQLNYNVQNANSVLIMVGDIPIAFAQTSGQNIDFGTESLYGIGTAKPQEIQQLKFAPTISIDSFVLSAQGNAFFNYPEILATILANNSFTINVMTAAGTPMFSFVGCVANGYNQNVPVNAVITQAITFQCMDVLDPLGNSILIGNFALNSLSTITAAGISLNTLGL